MLPSNPFLSHSHDPYGINHPYSRLVCSVAFSAGFTDDIAAAVAAAAAAAALTAASLTAIAMTIATATPASTVPGSVAPTTVAASTTTTTFAVADTAVPAALTASCHAACGWGRSLTRCAPRSLACPAPVLPTYLSPDRYRTHARSLGFRIGTRRFAEVCTCRRVEKCICRAEASVIMLRTTCTCCTVLYHPADSTDV